jgi:hypothetical protein
MIGKRPVIRSQLEEKPLPALKKGNTNYIHGKFNCCQPFWGPNCY